MVGVILNEYDNILPFNNLNYSLELKKIYLPFQENMNEYSLIKSSFSIYSLSNWFLYQPKIEVKDNIIKMEIVVIPIQDNIVYYKFPNKYKLFL